MLDKKEIEVEDYGMGTELEENINKDLVIETSIENTRMIKDFIDEYLDDKKPNKNLKIMLEEDLKQSSNRREVLLSRGINKIDVKDISFDEKNKEIEELHKLSLNQLESRYGKKNEELEALTNNSILSVANSFVKTYKGKTTDQIQVASSFDEFMDKKASKIIDEQVENSDIFKSYQEKMSKYVRENKNKDSVFMKLLDHYINLPNKILEKQFKDVLKEELKQEMLSKKDVTLQKIQDSFKEKSKKKSKSKSKGMKR